MFSNFLNQIPQMLLMLPAILLSLSVHETAHGLVAYKLGDPTAKNLGRLTLNPIKHINPIGFLSMMFFGVGWANPVPINTRYFKNPRKGMALTAAAGPISNLLLAIIFTLILRIVMIPMQPAIDSAIMAGDFSGEELFSNMGFLLLAILATILYLGIFLNINLMLFNLIPLPPLDGSRIAYIFLPTDLYFKIMKYERYIMIAFIVLLATNIITVPLGTVNGYISDLLYKITDMPVNYLYYSINGVLSRLPTFSL